MKVALVSMPSEPPAWILMLPLDKVLAPAAVTAPRALRVPPLTISPPVPMVREPSAFTVPPEMVSVLNEVPPGMFNVPEETVRSSIAAGTVPEAKLAGT